MGVMKENFLRNAHDTTFSPTGLYNFVSGSLLTDSSGADPAKNLTENDAPIDEVDFIPGSAEGLSHFTYYRNSNTDFKYTGAMSFCCLFYTTDDEPNSTNGQHYFVTFDASGAAGAALYALQITKIGGTLPYEIHYAHESQEDEIYRIGTGANLPRNHKWQHLAFTRDSNGTGIKIYLNGAEIVSGTLAKAPGADVMQNSGHFTLGNIYNFPNSRNSTYVQTSCAIYDQELTANQIKYLARKTLGYDVAT